MKSTDKLHISGLDMIKDEMETITFGQFLDEVFQSSFDDIFKDNFKKENKQNEETCDLERSA